MKHLLIVFLLCGLGVAQIPKPQPADTNSDGSAKFSTYDSYIEALVDWKMQVAKARAIEVAKPKTLAACRADFKDAVTNRDEAFTELAAARQEIADIQKENTDLKAKNAEAAKNYTELRNAAMEVIKFNTQLQAEFKKTVEDRNDMADRYNSLLNEANERLDSANSRLARQNQVTNALAVYSLMQRYTPPPQLQIYQPPPRLQTNCRSYMLGNTVQTDCN